MAEQEEPREAFYTSGSGRSPTCPNTDCLRAACGLSCIVRDSDRIAYTIGVAIKGVAKPDAIQCMPLPPPCFLSPLQSEEEKKDAQQEAEKEAKAVDEQPSEASRKRKFDEKEAEPDPTPTKKQLRTDDDNVEEQKKDKDQVAPQATPATTTTTTTTTAVQPDKDEEKKQDEDKEADADAKAKDDDDLQFDPKAAIDAINWNMESMSKEEWLRREEEHIKTVFVAFGYADYCDEQEHHGYW